MTGILNHITVGKRLIGEELKDKNGKHVGINFFPENKPVAAITDSENEISFNDLGDDVYFAIAGSTNDEIFWQIGGGGLNYFLKKYLNEEGVVAEGEKKSGLDQANDKLREEGDKLKKQAEELRKAAEKLKEEAKKLRKEPLNIIDITSEDHATGMVTTLDLPLKKGSQGKVKKIAYSASPDLTENDEATAKKRMIDFGKKFRAELGRNGVKKVVLPIFSGSIYSGGHDSAKIAEWFLEGFTDPAEFVNPSEELKPIEVYFAHDELNKAWRKITEKVASSENPISVTYSSNSRLLAAARLSDEVLEKEFSNQTEKKDRIKNLKDRITNLEKALGERVDEIVRLIEVKNHLVEKKDQEFAEQIIKRLFVNRQLAQIKSADSPEKREEKLSQLVAFFSLFSKDVRKLSYGKGLEDSSEFLIPLLDALYSNSPISFNNKITLKDSGFELESTEEKVGAVIALEISSEPNESVANLLDNGMQKEEVLEGQNQYNYGGDKVDAKRKISFFVENDASEIVFHLKRFRFDIDGSESKKIPNPIELNNIKLPNRNEEEKEFTCTAFIKHDDTIKAGHYTSYVKCSDEKWYLFDDSRVSEVGAEELKEAMKNCYVAKYSRVVDVPLPSPPLNSAEAGTKNAGNTCWANSSIAFLSSFTSFDAQLKEYEKELEDDPEKQKKAPASSSDQAPSNSGSSTASSGAAKAPSTSAPPAPSSSTSAKNPSSSAKSSRTVAPGIQKLRDQLDSAANSSDAKDPSQSFGRLQTNTASTSATNPSAAPSEHQKGQGSNVAALQEKLLFRSAPSSSAVPDSGSSKHGKRQIRIRKSFEDRLNRIFSGISAPAPSVPAPSTPIPAAPIKPSSTPPQIRSIVEPTKKWEKRLTNDVIPVLHYPSPSPRAKSYRAITQPYLYIPTVESDNIFSDMDHAHSIRVVAGIYENPFGLEFLKDDKASEQARIEEIMCNVILLMAHKHNLSFRDMYELGEYAEKNGGVGNRANLDGSGKVVISGKVYSDNSGEDFNIEGVSFRNATSCSADIQSELKKCGIYAALVDVGAKFNKVWPLVKDKIQNMKEDFLPDDKELKTDLRGFRNAEALVDTVKRSVQRKIAANPILTPLNVVR